MKSIGSKEIYPFLRKDLKKKVKRSIFIDIVKDLNAALFDVLLEEGMVRLPLDLAVLYLELREYEPKLVNGKLTGLPPINWAKTNEIRKSGHKGFVRQDWKHKLILRSKKSMRRRTVMRHYLFEYYRSAKTRLREQEQRLIYEQVHRY
jgi:hypothetical protein